MSLRTGIPLGAAAIAAAFVATTSAHAELYRCVGANGRVTFSDNAAACPGSQPHEPADVVQKVTTSVPARSGWSGPGTAPNPIDEAQAAEEQKWRQKRVDAQTELAAVGERQEYLDRFLTHCRRGGTLLRTDEAGLRFKVSCKEVDAEWDALAARETALQAYLATGLEEECRRAGCLPGWVR